MSLLSVLWTLAANKLGDEEMETQKYLPVFSGLGYSIIFGFSFMFTKEGLEVISTFHILALRFALAAIFMTLLKFFGFIKIDFRGKRMRLLLLLALVQPVLYFIFETMGIKRTTSSEAGLMIALIPVAVTIMAAFILKERPTKVQIPFIILSVVGVMFIVLMRGSLDLQNNFAGIIFLLGAVIMAGFHNILTRILSINFKPVEITFIMMWSGAIIFNLLAVKEFHNNFTEYFLPLSNGKVLVSVVYLGILSSVAAYFMMNFTLTRIEAFQAAVYANLVTVVSVFAGVFFRQEPFYWFQILGAIMIIAGVWGTNYFGEFSIEAEKLPS